MSISAVILTKNASKTIEKSLESLRWCDEILVIDDNSVDNTLAVAKKQKVKGITHSLSNDFSSQRNFALAHAFSEWVLFIDQDEVVSENLKKEIQSVIKSNKVKGYYIKREDYMWGKRLSFGETGNLWLLRLAQKEAGLWKGKVHEAWEVTGKVGKLQNSLQHYPHPTTKDFLLRIQFYTTLRAEELFAQGVHVRFLDIILYPKAKFIVNYFFKRGLLDGVRGLLVALLMSFHSFLVRAKLWHLWQTQTKSF